MVWKEANLKPTRKKDFLSKIYRFVYLSFVLRPLRSILVTLICVLMFQMWILYTITSVFHSEDPMDTMSLVRPYRPGNCLYINYIGPESTSEYKKTDAAFFYKNFVTKDRPVVLVGASKSWPAYEKWTSAYLVNKAGDIDVMVAVGNKSERGFGLHAKTKRLQMPFREFVDKMQNSITVQYYVNLQNSNYSAPTKLLKDNDIVELLKSDYKRPPFMKFHVVRETNFWMGPHDIVSRLHHDSSENILVQVHGTKKFIIFPPEQGIYLYPFNESQTHFSSVDIDEPDYVKFPLLKNAEPTECIVNGGDMLYVPSNWWHQVYSTGSPNLAMNFWYERQNLADKALSALRIYIGDK